MRSPRAQCVTRYVKPLVREGLSRPALAISFLAVDLLAALVALLRLQGQRSDRPRVEALQSDRLSRLLAIAVSTVLDACQGRVDFGDKLALAVARAQFQRAVGL